MYDSRTHQRLTDILDIRDDVEPLELQQDEETLKIKWNDGHTSIYSKSWLAQNAPRKLSDETNNINHLAELWTSKTIQQRNSRISFESYMTDNETLKTAMKILLRDGFVMIDGVPEKSTERGTLPTVERMTRIADTMYGKSFEFTSKHEDSFSDTAYTKMSLLPHTDMTYLTEASGLQIFHILQEAEEGGETILVDGFEVAKQFRDESPDGYDFFSKTYPVESEYIHTASEPHEHYYQREFIFQHYPGSSRLKQVRFNVYDRAPHTGLASVEEQKRFYKYYRHLSALFQKPENGYHLKLSPGTVIFLDNFRVLHGRTGFKGNRIMSGCYVQRADFLSRAKSVGLV